MRKLLPILLVFLLVLAACGGDDDDGGDVSNIADADTCDEVGQVFLTELQTLLDEVSGMSISDFSSEEQPEAMTNFEASVDEIGAKSDELGCTDEEIASYLEDNIDTLEAEGPVAEILLQGFQEGIESGELLNSGD